MYWSAQEFHSALVINRMLNMAMITNKPTNTGRNQTTDLDLSLLKNFLIPLP